MVDHRATRAREIQRAIENELLRGWDPLGVRHEPACRDEYDCYVAGVYRLLTRRASVADIAEHLALKEQSDLGFTSPRDRLLEVATRLKSIDVDINPSGDAVEHDNNADERGRCDGGC